MSYQLILNNQDDSRTALIELEHGYRTVSSRPETYPDLTYRVNHGAVLTFRENVTPYCFKYILDMIYNPKGQSAPRIKYRLVGPCGNEASGEAVVISLSMSHDVDDETGRGEMLLKLSIK